MDLSGVHSGHKHEMPKAAETPAISYYGAARATLLKHHQHQLLQLCRGSSHPDWQQTGLTIKHVSPFFSSVSLYILYFTSLCLCPWHVKWEQRKQVNVMRVEELRQQVFHKKVCSWDVFANRQWVLKLLHVGHVAPLLSFWQNSSLSAALSFMGLQGMFSWG